MDALRQMAEELSEGYSPKEIFENRLQKFLDRMEDEKPRRQDYDTDQEFQMDFHNWELEVRKGTKRIEIEYNYE